MTASRPARAFRGATVLIVAAVAARVPTMQRAFEGALAAARDPQLPVAGRTAFAPIFIAMRSPPPPGRTAVVVAPARPAIADRPKPPLYAPDPIEMVLAVIAGAVEPPVGRAVAPPIEPPVAAPTLVARTWPAEPSDTHPDPGALATAAYARLAKGDRRAAVRFFDAALVGDDARAPGWQRQRDALTRRWSGSAYSIVRSAGDAALTTTPVLGGGQSGGGLTFTPVPLARRPLALTLRGSVAHDDAGRTGFAAVGVQWRPVAAITVAAERLIAIGPAAHGTWTLRAAGGVERTHRRWRATGYGEGGIIGSAPYLAGQARIAAILTDGGVSVAPGAGVWASVEHDRRTVDRFDVGPGVIVQSRAFAVEVDYRVRVAGNAAPGSGPVVTLRAAF